MDLNIDFVHHFYLMMKPEPVTETSFCL